MKQSIFLAISMILLLSCDQMKDSNKAKPEETGDMQKEHVKTDNIFWHKKQIIEQIIKETDSVYIVHIGIMAQAFNLERKNNPHFDKDLKLLNKSLLERKKLDIGIKNGSNRIIIVMDSSL